jgi:hypothetical protein
VQRGRVLARPISAAHPQPSCPVTKSSSLSIARQIADVDAQIADTELRILQSQKRVENRVAKGADVTELKSAIAALTKVLTYLEACKARLHQQRQGCGGQ